MNRRGFGLLEAVVAIAIGSVALSTGFGALAHARDAWARVREPVDEVVTAAATRGALKDWIAGAFLDPHLDDAPAFTGTDASEGGVSADRLSFVTASSGGVLPNGASVLLYVQEGSGLLADYVTFARTGTLALDPDAMGVEIRYLQREPRRWVDVWFSTVELPLAVELTVRRPHGGRTPALLELPILIVLQRRT